jgi:hypothetical protein
MNQFIALLYVQRLFVSQLLSVHLRVTAGYILIPTVVLQHLCKPKYLQVAPAPAVSCTFTGATTGSGEWYRQWFNI